MRDYSFVLEEQDPEVKRELMRELGKTDLFFLCKYVLNFKDMEETTDLHHAQCDEYRYLDEGTHGDRLAVMVFRNSFKTSIGCGWVIQNLARNPDLQIGVGSSEKDRAIDRVKSIKEVLEDNQLLKDLYPECFFQNPRLESDDWTKESLVVRRSPAGSVTGGFRKPSVSAFGLDPLPTGSHYDIALVDDIENEANCRDEQLITKLTQNFGAFIPTLNPGAKVALLGTIYCEDGPNTLYQKKWRTYKRAIVDKYGLPTFPSRFSLEVIAAYKKDINDDYIWAGQYLLRPHPRTDLFFYPYVGTSLQSCRHHKDSRGESFVVGDQAYPLNETLGFLLIDPGGGASEEQKKAQPKVILDSCGFCYYRVTRDNKWIVVEMFQKHMSDEQLVDYMFKSYESNGLSIVAVEKMPHLDAFFRAEFKQRGKAIPIHELKPKKRSKDSRIRAMKVLLPQIYFVDNIHAVIQNDLRKWYTEQEHDDNHFDAWAYGPDVLRPPTKEMLSAIAKQHQERDDRERLAQLSPNERKEWEHLEKLMSVKSQTSFQNEYEDFLR